MMSQFVNAMAVIVLDAFLCERNGALFQFFFFSHLAGKKRYKMQLTIEDQKNGRVTLLKRTNMIMKSISLMIKKKEIRRRNVMKTVMESILPNIRERK